MSKKRIAINGFGRIGRITFRNLINDKDIEIVAINDLTETAMLAHLLKYDTAHGKFDGEVEVSEGALIVNGKTVKSFSIRDPEELPWAELEIDVVLECTGIFRTRESAGKHLTAGAKKVVISAPAKSDDVKTVVLGVNDDILEGSEKIVSNASCTTNCLAPMVKIVLENFGWKNAYMSTIHAYTGAQNLQDGPNSKDWRRARAAAQNIVPTTTGSADAVGLVIPEVEGKIMAEAVRVPIITGSLVQLTINIEKETTIEAVKQAFKEQAEGPMKGILSYVEDPIVSSDIVSDKHSCIFDAELTDIMDGTLLKIVAWYDNEAGYSARMADLARRI